MKNLNIRVTNKVAQYQLRDGAIVCGNSDYQITFTFDSEWNLYPKKTARFIWNGKYLDVVFEGNICPAPIISDATEVLVGVYAGDLCTTTPASIPCKRSILCSTSTVQDEKVKEYRDQALVAAERAEAATGGLQPNFAESEAWLEEHGDTDKIYVLCNPASANDGMIFACKKTEVEGGGDPNNLVPKSIDTDGSIFGEDYNGDGVKDGYKRGVRLSSSGGISGELQSGSVTTGLIPYKAGQTIRMKGVEFIGASAKYGGHFYVNFYSDDDKINAKIALGEGAFVDGTGSCTTYDYDEQTGIATLGTITGASSAYGTAIDASSWIRLTVRGDGTDFILTVDEEISDSSDNTTTIVYEWFNTGHAFVPADYEGRIIALEEQSVENANDIKKLEEKIGNILDGNTEISASTKFDATVYNLPVLYLTGDIAPIFVSKDNEVNLNYTYGERSGTCKLKGQGSSSYKMAKAFIEQGKAGKFNYTIKFDEAFEVKEGTIFKPDKNELGKWYAQQWWGKQKKYCLKANWIDHTHARNIVSAKIWSGIVKSRANANPILKTLPHCGAVDGFPVVIVLNDEFHGLYTFNIPKDGWMLTELIVTNKETGEATNGEEPMAIVSAHDHSDGTSFKAQLTGKITDDDRDDFELEFATDESDTDWVITSLNTLINACINSNGTDLDTTVAKYLDWDSAIDYYIHTVVIRGEDMVDKNFLLGTFDGTKWFFNVYDMDSTFGLAWDASRLNRPVSDISFTACADTNRVFELIKNYKKDALKARYSQLRADILSESRMSQTFENFAWDIPSPVLAEDVKKYPTIRGSSVNGIDQICRWIRQRLETCDKWINEL